MAISATMLWRDINLKTTIFNPPIFQTLIFIQNPRIKFLDKMPIAKKFVQQNVCDYIIAKKFVLWYFLKISRTFN